MHLPGPGTVAVSDLDGDHIPDIASGTKTGHIDEGYAYRVDLALTTNRDSKSFFVYSDEPTGLNVEAIDVDGDQDLDLVITSHLRRDRIGVWLNDGNGRFTRTDPQRYNPLIWQHQSATPCKSRSPRAVNFEPRRPQVVLERHETVITTFHFSSRAFGCGPCHPFEVASESARLRAPPALTIL